MLGEGTQVTVDLLVRVREARPVGQVLGLIEKATPEAARIDLLKTHEVVFAHQRCDPVEVLQTLPMGQNMFPAAGQVVAEIPGIHADLDVVAQEPQRTAGRWPEPGPGLFNHRTPQIQIGAPPSTGHPALPGLTWRASLP